MAFVTFWIFSNQPLHLHHCSKMAYQTEYNLKSERESCLRTYFCIAAQFRLETGLTPEDHNVLT